MKSLSILEVTFLLSVGVLFSFATAAPVTTGTTEDANHSQTNVSPPPSAVGTTADDVMQSIANLQRPYPSVSLSEDDQWDIVIILDYSVPSTNYASMYEDGDNYDMLRKITTTDCETPASEWYYPNGTCITLDLSIGAPTASLDSNTRESFLAMDVLDGSYRLENSDVNETQSLTGLQFNAITKVAQTVMDETKNFIYLDGSNSSVSVVEGTYPNETNPEIISYIADIAREGFRNNSQSIETYPFLQFNNVNESSSGVSGKTFSPDGDTSAALIPTSTQLVPFTTDNGTSLLACLMMTMGHEEPSGYYIDTSIEYMADGMNFFMLISNKLVMNYMILQVDGYQTASVSKNTSSGHLYYNVNSEWFTGQNFSAYMGKKGSSDPTKTCVLDDFTTFNIDLQGAYVSSIDGTVKSYITVSSLEATYDNMYYCGLCDGCKDYSPATYDVTLDYDVTATLEVSGGYLNSSITTDDKSSYPSNSEFDQQLYASTYETYQAVGDDVKTSAQLDNFLGSFNIFKDDVQAIFGPSDDSMRLGMTANNLTLSSAGMVYDLMLIGYVNFSN
eukprot:Nk52_evm27s367 gene=Nk52_evmTU27s367